VRARAAAALAAAALAGCGAAAHAPRRAAPPDVLPVQVSGDQPTGEHATAFPAGRGRALTVAHVLRAGRRVVVGRRRARVVRIDRRLDVAVLAVPGLAPTAPRRATARAGDRVTVRVLRDGAARALPATIRRRITARVSAAAGEPVQVRPALELAVAVMPGDSGAPVVAGDGAVVGIVFAAATDRDAVAYALDARALPPA
jgi:S1-C subfamily serine protease